MLHSLIAEFLGTMMLILLGDGVVANVTLNKSGMKGAGSILKQNTMEADTFLLSPLGLLVFLLPCLSSEVSALTLPWHYARQFLA